MRLEIELLLHAARGNAITSLPPAIGGLTYPYAFHYNMDVTGVNGATYSWPAMLVSGSLAMLLLAWFHRLAYPKSEEERRQDLLAQGLHAEA